MAAAVVVFCALSTVHAATTPLFLPIDESSHAGYAASLAHGRLPDVDTPIPRGIAPGLATRLADDRTRGRAGRLDVWTANHPPLYPAIAAVPLALGERFGQRQAGIAGARVLTVLLGALGVALCGVLAGVLVPGRPAVAVSAAGTAALVPSFAHISGLLYLDALAVTTTTAALVCATAVLARGPTRWRVARLALAAAVAAGTRSTGLVVAALAVLAAGIAPLLWRRRQGLAAGVGAALAVLLATAAGSVWYLRNLQRYGDLTGATVLLEKFGREPGPAPVGLLGDAAQWRLLHDSLWSTFARTPPPEGPLSTTLLGMSTALAVLVALALVRLARQRPLPSRPLVAAWLLALALPVGLLVAVALFVSQGGNLHGRYLLPALGVFAVTVGGALSVASGRLRPVFGAYAWTAFVVHLLLIGTFLERLGGSLSGRLPAPFGEAATAHVAAAACTVAAFALVVVVRTHGRLVRAGSAAAQRGGAQP